MKSIPVIFLAFANDRMDGSGYLRNLPVEQRQITKALEPAVDAGLCELVTVSNATIDQILDTFQKKRYKDRISIFHFGGHADGYQLLLETEAGEKSVAHGEGLVSFLANQQGLQLIFLNGCSTEEQSQELTEEGVPLVIGTTATIPDKTATRLAARFYSSLGNGASIKRAWREAKDEVNMRVKRGGQTERKIDFTGEKNAKNQGAIPWRFFVKEGAEIVKEWNLPDAAGDPLFACPPLPVRDLPEAPFRFLKWYEEEQAEIFFGRSHMIRDLYDRITDTLAAPLVLLYGKSGVGKSSLLDAGLLPRLKQTCEVAYVRRKNELSLLDSLTWQLTPNLSGGNPASDMHQTSGDLQALKDLWIEKEKASGKPFVIILDQVEGIYTETKAQKGHELEDLLAVAKEIFKDFSDRPLGKLMFVYRKEYHPEIETACKTLQIPREQVFF